MSMKLINDDALRVMCNMSECSVDMIVTDPPYRTISGGPGGSDGRPTGMLTKNDGLMFGHNNIEVEQWMPELFRVLRSPGHCYVMVNLMNLWRFHAAAIDAGFKVHNLLVWKKQNVTPNRWFMKNCEYILFLRKGPARSIYTQGVPMVIEARNPVGEKSHPTEKPVGLMTTLIRASAQPGETVFDPFMGSGATGVAAVSEGCDFVGVEIDPEYFHPAMARITRMPL